jgi:hypothetical protein
MPDLVGSLPFQGRLGYSVGVRRAVLKRYLRMDHMRIENAKANSGGVY